MGEGFRLGRPFYLCIMNKLQLFNSPEFGEIRVSMDADGEPLFCACDLCRALEYANGRDVVRRRLDERDVFLIDTPTKNQYGVVVVQKITFVNESGMYTLVLGSRNKKAKPFRRWVTSEVLPTIRKTGSYSLPKMTDEQQEYLRYAQACDACDRKEGFRALAKKIRFTTNMKIDARHVKAWMHDNGYLCSANGVADYPTELALTLGLMIIRMPWNEIRYDRTPAKGKIRVKVTPKGARFFVNKLTDVLMSDKLELRK